MKYSTRGFAPRRATQADAREGGARCGHVCRWHGRSCATAHGATGASHSSRRTRPCVSHAHLVGVPPAAVGCIRRPAALSRWHGEWTQRAARAAEHGQRHEHGEQHWWWRRCRPRATVSNQHSVSGRVSMLCCIIPSSASERASKQSDLPDCSPSTTVCDAATPIAH
jgi:hypothetical protein